MRWALVAVFALTYAGLSSRRAPLPRPALALVGAVVMLALGAFSRAYGLSLDDALRAVELHTLALLLGTMLLSSALDEAGFFALVASWVARRVRSPVALVYAITLASGVLSALLLNDAVCLLGAPLVATLARRLGVPARPLLLGLAMGANTGSALTLNGNPQNMLVARLSGLSFARYLRLAAWPSLGALALTAALVHLLHRGALRAAPQPEAAPEPPPARDPLLLSASLCAVLAMLACNLAGVPLALSALLAAALVLVASGKRADKLLSGVDYGVLLFFASLFVLVAGLQRTGVAQQLLAHLPSGPRPLRWPLLLTLTAGSQVVSNVPLILLLEPWLRSLGDGGVVWPFTAVVSTLAGNLTLLGSVANVIVFERAREPIGFWEYLRVGVPVTLATLGWTLLLLR